jgi:hypothetical protein
VLGALVFALVRQIGVLYERVAPAGALVLSGLLLEDVPPVREAFAASGTPREHRLGEWAALVIDPVETAR